MQHVDLAAPDTLALPKTPVLTHEQQQVVEAVQPPVRDPVVPGFLALPRAPGMQVAQA